METKQCGKCGKPMKLRKGGYGEFWGCTGYPTCKNTEQLSDAPPKPFKSSPISETKPSEGIFQSEVINRLDEILSLLKNNLGE